MNNNHTLRLLQQALQLDNAKMVELFALSDYTLTEQELEAMLAAPEDKQFVRCTDPELIDFLDGLITDRRGPRETAADKPEATPSKPKKAHSITNNDILKKLRIALELKEEDMLGIFKHLEIELTRHELGALFRKPKHKNYRECEDELLQDFFDALKIAIASEHLSSKHLPLKHLPI